MVSILLVLALSGCSERTGDNAPLEVFRFCESESGQSRYYVHLDVVRSKGILRYQYLEQDVQYSVSDLAHFGKTIQGFADFEKSATGEERGNRFSFVYDFEAEQLLDLGVVYQCLPLQDVSLLHLPK